MIKLLTNKKTIEKEICKTAKIFGEEYSVEIIYTKINNPELDLIGKTIKVYLPGKYKKLKYTGIVKIALEKMYDEIARVEIENVMEETGKQNKVFVSSDDIFQNTECLFIEYDDVLKSPMFSLLNIIKDRESVKKIFDMTEFDGLTSNELYEWYVERESKNMFKYLDLLDDSLTNIFDDDVNVFYRWCDSFYEDMYKSLPHCQPAAAYQD